MANLETLQHIFLEGDSESENSVEGVPRSSKDTGLEKFEIGNTDFVYYY
jgi:hypothetical protein